MILGIDLGTTHSLVGTIDAGFPILLAGEDGRRILPSVVHFPVSGAPFAGEKARRMLPLAPSRTVASVKRLMGRRLSEVDPASFPLPLTEGPGGAAHVQIGDESHPPEAISAVILAQLKANAEQAMETTIDRAVITVPAYFNDAQRQATVRAGELAGFHVERIVSEPTAAALAYGLDKLGDRARVAVYDLGGGTFDISILELREGVFQVLATSGNTRLGGDDLDGRIADWVTKRFGAPSGAEGRARLREEARAAKERLSAADSVEIRLPFYRETESVTASLDRTTFEELARPVLEKTRPHCLRALSDAGIASPSSELDAVILVGGSTRIPAVHALVAEIFGRDPDTSQHPDEAVALGATIQAGVLSGALKDIVLLDVTPLSLGIETFGGLMNVIIPRNTTVPAKAGEMFTNAVAGQPSMLIRVLQGEREMARDNWELGRLTLEFDPGPKASARVGVQFELDENGILTILGRDTKTGRDHVLEIQSAAVDVDDEKVEAMIAESVDLAFEDMNERVWTEARLKAEELLTAVEEAMRQIGAGVPEDERRQIDSCAEEVRLALDEGPKNTQRLQSANQGLDEATEALAARLVERALDRALE